MLFMDTTMCRSTFDEDEGAGECWEEREVENPLAWQTEREFIERFERAVHDSQ